MSAQPAQRIVSLTSDVRAVLFDVDGTLYAQPPLRALIAAEFALAGARSMSWARTQRAARILRAFRRIREELRSLGEPESGQLEHLQFSQTADHVGCSADEVRRLVTEWIVERPLKHLRHVRRAGLQDLLSALESRHVRIGALSDYAVDAKLEALGVAGSFSLKLCTTDRAINAFKPHPKGFRHACEAWGMAPEEVLYVGDRPEIDRIGAAAAGLRCIIVGASGRHDDGEPGRSAGIRAFRELARAFVAG